MATQLVFQLYYYERENVFTDGDGHVVYDIFSMITPQDLFLFRYDHGNNCFPIVGDPDFLCEIIPVPGEDCGTVDSPDFGDDYERCGRLLTMYSDLFNNFERVQHERNI